MTHPNTFFVTGVHTGVGKTLVAASLALAGNGVYWKPVQTGHNKDSDEAKVKNWLAGSDSRVHPTLYSYSLPASPNIASSQENSEILINNIILPDVSPKMLVIEGVGGFLVPLNSSTLLGDWVVSLKIPIVVVIGGYLGCINHTLLTIEAIQKRTSVPLALVFCGDIHPDVSQTITHFTHLPVIGRIPYLEEPNPAEIVKNQWIKNPNLWFCGCT